MLKSLQGTEFSARFTETSKNSFYFSQNIFIYFRFLQWRTDPIYERRERERSQGVCDRCCHIGKKKVHDKSGCEQCSTIKSCHMNSDPDCLIKQDP